jgi:hypothetical protein
VETFLTTFGIEEIPFPIKGRRSKTRLNFIVLLQRQMTSTWRALRFNLLTNLKQLAKESNGCEVDIGFKTSITVKHA